MTATRSMIVMSLCLGFGIASAAPRVGVDLSRLESEAVSDAAALEQELVIRLLQEGFAIDPLSGEPTIVVAIAGQDHALVLSAKSAHFAKSRTIDVRGSSGAQLHLELVQRAVELARLAHEAVPPPSPRDPDAAAVDRVFVGRERAPRWQLGVDVGVAARRDIEVALHARYAIGYGFGAALRGSSAHRDAGEIDVGEQELLAGASYERPIATALVLDVSLLAGVRRHHFELAMPLAERSGTRFDSALAMPVRISLRPWRAFELSLWAVAKLAKERDHTSGTTVLWHRDAFGAGVGVGVAARF